LSVGGITTKPKAGQSLLDALVEADKALYEAKRRGKNTFEVHFAES
jgi:GGDEF domain-containing protein